MISSGSSLPRLALGWLSLAMSATGLADTEAFLTHPDIHGDKVVFTAEGDLWIADIRTGDAWRLTSDSGLETNAHFSPDGTQIAFSANYDGGGDVYVMPTAGGIPKRLTYDWSDDYSPGAAALGWTPDGRSVLFSSGCKLYAPKFEQELTQQVFTVPTLGGMPQLVPVPRGTYASLNADGRSLAYVPTSNFWMNWSGYQGGQADNIWLADLKTGSFTRLVDTKEVNTQPVWVGSALYFVSERTGVRNLWKIDPATRKATQVTFSKDLPIRFPSSDGHRIVYQRGPGLEVYDPETGTATPLVVHLHSDRPHARPLEVPVAGSHVGSLAGSGKRVAIEVRGHLVTVPIGDGTMRTLIGDSSQRVQNPACSPDGKKIAYVSDASGEEQLYAIDDADQATPRRITTGLTGEHGAPLWSPDGKLILLGNRNGEIQLVDATTGVVKTIAKSQGEISSGSAQGDFAFSPDSKWIAYALSPGWRYTSVYLYEVATGKSVMVSHPDIASSSPTFSTDGKYLFMLQDRSLETKWNYLSERLSHEYSTKVTGLCLSADTPSPFLPKSDEEPEPVSAPTSKVDLDGLSGRMFDMKVPAGPYNGLLAVPGKLVLQSDQTVLACEIATGAMSTLASDATALCLSTDGKKLLIDGAGGMRVIDTSGPSAPGTGALKLDGYTVTVDPAAEWRQMFEESWRVGRDFYYDPNMHGVDWNAVRKRYEAELPLVGCRSDLTQLTRDMISELSTGHSFGGARSEFTVRPPKVGLLGADLAWDEAAGAYRIAHIMRGDPWTPELRSPLAEPGVKVREGDFLLAIAGHPLRKDQDPAALLLGTIGNATELTVSSTPSLEGAHHLTVIPLASDSRLRRQDWVRARREYVEKATGGQVAYVYLSNMGSDGSNDFAEEYYPAVNKAGIILDVRCNDGGNISGNVLGDIGSKVSGYWAYRGGGNYRREGWAPLGQIVAIANEFSFSDADYFSDAFKRLKIGPLVGHRTVGGTVGSNWYRLVDGGGVGIPNYGAWFGNEWLVEGRGAIPDYEVEQDPAAVMAGKDPQLDKAIEVILARIKEHPLQVPQHPPYPVKRGG